MVLLGVLVSMFAGTVFADDVDPSPWRGREGTKLGAWEFATSSPMPLPSIYNGPPDGMAANVTGAWKEMVSGRGGVWEVSRGGVNIVLPGPQKLYRDAILGVQVTWMPSGSGTPSMQVTRGIGCDPVRATMMSQKPIGNGWVVSTLVAHWNPESVYKEITATIQGGVYVDGIVVETLDYDDPGNPVDPTR
jgi:hypothetical protein